MPKHPHQRAKRLMNVLLAAMAMSVTVLPGYSSPVSNDGEKPAARKRSGIMEVQEKGRTVYVNDLRPAPVAPTPVSGGRHSVLVYWSNAERRWKPVPAPSRAAMRAARNAADEVRGYVASQPKISEASPAVADPNYATLARGYRVSAPEIDAAIEQAASKNGVDPNLVRALIKVESNFNPNAVSNKGAMGLMQLMPRTASGLSVSNPFDPQQNVDAGVRHLRQLLDTNGGDVRLSLAAYNAGQRAVTRSGGVPPYAETRNYVKRITELYWNKNGRTFAPSALPVHTYRGDDGVIHMTNTE